MSNYIQSNPELRQKARERLQHNWGPAILICFLYGLIVTIPSLPKFFFENPSMEYVIANLIGYIVNLFITGALVFGLAGFFINFVREIDCSATDLFDGFSQYGRSLALHLLMTLFVLLWMLLFIIPGIIAAYRYSLAFYLLRDNPDMGPMEAINESKRLMYGYKGQLFELGLSFIGWVLLCLLTLGIGFFWLSPYMYTSYIYFYESRIKLEQSDIQDSSAPNTSESI